MKIAKIPLQISLKHLKPFLAFLINFWQKNWLNDNLFPSATAATLGGISAREINEPFGKIKTSINDLR